MRFIKHNDPPIELKKRARNSVKEPIRAWATFGSKDKVRENLRYCQNDLCGYCEIEINVSSLLGSHIEHIKNKSVHPSLTFDYHNLILSCFQTGGEFNALGEDLNSVSCGHSTGKRNAYDENLFISPTESNCQSYFFYELTGEIVPHPSFAGTSIEYQRAAYTIDLLKLNCARLVRQRQEVVEQGYKIIAELNYGKGDKNHEALLHFFELELTPAASEYQQYFAFISLRQQLWLQDYQQLRGNVKDSRC